jgi:hypothetical protein
MTFTSWWSSSPSLCSDPVKYFDPLEILQFCLGEGWRAWRFQLRGEP